MFPYTSVQPFCTKTCRLNVNIGSYQGKINSLVYIGINNYPFLINPLFKQYSQLIVYNIL